LIRCLYKATYEMRMDTLISHFFTSEYSKKWIQ